MMATSVSQFATHTFSQTWKSKRADCQGDLEASKSSFQQVFYLQYIQFFSFHRFRRVPKENLVPAPKKIENEAEKMDMSVAAEEMEVIVGQHWRCLVPTLWSTWLSLRWWTTMAWSTLTQRMWGTHSWSVLSMISLVLLLLLTSYSGHELCQRDLQLLTHHGKGTGCEGRLPRWTDGDESFEQYS